MTSQEMLNSSQKKYEERAWDSNSNIIEHWGALGQGKKLDNTHGLLCIMHIAVLICIKSLTMF